MVHYYIPYWSIFMLIFEINTSERALSKALSLSRTTLRKVLNSDESIKLSTLQAVANYFNLSIQYLTHPKDHVPDSTTVATGFRINRDGFNSWKIHLMDMVDEFRKTKDARLFVLPPDKSCDEKIKALIAATVIELCEEVGTRAPSWALSCRPLENPWFVSGMESLKASALLEAPWSFRSKNIFVHKNFLERA